MFARGYLTLFRLRGIPIRAHWSVPLGMLVFTGLRIAPGAWLGVLLIILLHELGHAALVWRSRLLVIGIDLTGMGGVCRWTGDPTPRQRAAIAWGGVLAQLAVAAVAFPVAWLVGPQPGFVGELLDALTRINLMIAALNLVPFPPLDGAEAWPWFKHWREDRARRAKWKKKVSARPEDAPPQTLAEALRDADRRKDP